MLIFFRAIFYSTTPGLYKDLRCQESTIICPGKLHMSNHQLPHHILQNTTNIYLFEIKKILFGF
jgi:hypothetical protein